MNIGDDTFNLLVKKHHFSWRFFLSALVVWVLWVLVLTAIFKPKIQKAWQESGIASLLEKQPSNQGVLTKERVVTLALNKKGEIASYTIETTKRGGSRYHDAIEALIHDYPQIALQDGAFSLLHPKTALLGLTVKKGICYVNFSKEFLLSPTIEPLKAEDLVKATLLQFEEIQEVVLLVEGEKV